MFTSARNEQSSDTSARPNGTGGRMSRADGAIASHEQGVQARGRQRPDAGMDLRNDEWTRRPGPDAGAARHPNPGTGGCGRGRRRRKALKGTPPASTPATSDRLTRVYRMRGGGGPARQRGLFGRLTASNRQGSVSTAPSPSGNRQATLLPPIRPLGLWVRHHPRAAPPILGCESRRQRGDERCRPLLPVCRQRAHLPECLP